MNFFLYALFLNFFQGNANDFSIPKILLFGGVESSLFLDLFLGKLKSRLLHEKLLHFFEFGWFITAIHLCTKMKFLIFFRRSQDVQSSDDDEEESQAWKLWWKQKKIDVIFLHFCFVFLFPPPSTEKKEKYPHKIPASRGSWILFCQLISITNFGPLTCSITTTTAIHDSLSKFSFEVRLIKGTTYFTISPSPLLQPKITTYRRRHKATVLNRHLRTRNKFV